MELVPGTSVDRFVVEDLLGRGGMASVYRIRHRDLNVAYALKIMHVTHPDLAGRIKSEGALQAELRHPNIVTVFDMLEISGVPALVMELVDGPSLAALLDVHRPNLEQIDDIARGVMKGVRTAHARGLIHRDLKPANVLMAHADEGYLPKITDFGLAKMLAGSTSAVQTRTGAVMGTPTYMAPEQFRNSRAVDARADIYSLGVMFYELVAGRRPYDAEDLFDLLDAVRNAEYPRITELVPGIPDRMADAIEGAMTVDPRQRIPDVETLYQVWCGKVRVERSRIWERAVLKQIGENLSNAPVDIATGLPRTQPGAGGASDVIDVPRVLTPPALPDRVEPEPPEEEEEEEVPASADEGTRFEMRPRPEPVAPANAPVKPVVSLSETALFEEMEPAVEDTADDTAESGDVERGIGDDMEPAATEEVEPAATEDVVAPVLPLQPPLPPEVLLHTRTVAPDALPSLPPSLDPSLDGSMESIARPTAAMRKPELHDSTPSLHLPPPPGGSSVPPALSTASKPGLAVRTMSPEIRPRRSAGWLMLPVLVALVGIGFAVLVVSLGAATFWMRPAGETAGSLPPIELLPVPGEPVPATGAPVPVAVEPVPETIEPVPMEVTEPPEEPEVPEAAPETPAAPTPGPKPKPKPTVSSRGRVRLTGDAGTIRLVGADGRSFGPGSVPVGEYKLRAVFPDQEVDQTVPVTVRKGVETVIHCKTGFYSCTVK